ncbi:unnamed protein product [Moneuplotes crassus]|uniref:U-box domain-containing protein n=1 Tax=Euplotes crassus TaxID=5936 RepID=A0AAD1UKB9_EUPCR|nr:unnamed protein product [Moneuplotes crassus]
MGYNCQGCCNKGQIMKQQRDRIEDLEEEVRNKKRRCKRLQKTVNKLNSGQYTPRYLWDKESDDDSGSEGGYNQDESDEDQTYGSDDSDNENQECNSCEEKQQEIDHLQSRLIDSHTMLLNADKEAQKSKSEIEHLNAKITQLKEQCNSFNLQAQQIEESCGSQKEEFLQNKKDLEFFKKEVRNFQKDKARLQNVENQAQTSTYELQSQTVEKDNRSSFNNTLTRDHHLLELLLEKDLHISALEKSCSAGECAGATKKRSSLDSNYKIWFTKLMKQLKESVQCPISLCPITSPAICPSGITVDKHVFTKLVQDKSKDPFTKLSTCKTFIPNRHMTEILTILSEFSSIQA